MSWQKEVDELRRLGAIERFGVEEIIAPRDTRKPLCASTNLAAPSRKPGPRSFGYRP
jgi:hypothetical protein